MIDFVIPWVDGNDLLWLDKKSRYLGQNCTSKDETNSNMRYRDWGMLKYVLRGIEKNCPWYNKIFLITEGHYPDWLDIDNLDIRLITHKSLYFNKEHLPTFNSTSIEMNLPNLDILSDKFVYMNDDLLILKYTPKERFFRDGLPVDFFSHGWLPRNNLFASIRGMNTWAHSIKNNIDLIAPFFKKENLSKDQLYSTTYSFLSQLSNFLFYHVYKKVFWIEHYHHPIPYLKSTLLEVKQQFGKNMEICSANRFRAKSDLNQYIYRYWQLAHGNFYPERIRDNKYYHLASIKDVYKCLMDLDTFRFVCLNDSLPDELPEDEYEKIKNKIIKKLDDLLPEKSSFEIR